MEPTTAQDGTRSDVGSQLRNTTREITNKALVANWSSDLLITDGKQVRFLSGAPNQTKASVAQKESQINEGVSELPSKQ